MRCRSRTLDSPTPPPVGIQQASDDLPVFSISHLEREISTCMQLTNAPSVLGAAERGCGVGDALAATLSCRSSA